MIRYLFTYILLLTAGYSQAQSYSIPQVGLTFEAPAGFTFNDSSSHTQKVNSELEVWRKSFNFSGDSSNFMVMISSSTQKGIDWNNIHFKESKHFYDQSRIRNPELQYDSSYGTILIGSQLFNSFNMTVKSNGKVTRVHTQFAKYINGYMIRFSYDHRKPETAMPVENYFKSFKF